MPRTLGSGALGSGTMGNSVTLGTDRILKYLPRWLYNGPLSSEVAASAGFQLDAIEALAIPDQIFIETATGDRDPLTGGLSNWELDYGIPTVTSDSDALRRSRILARIRGQVARNDVDYLAIVRALLSTSTANPTPFVTPGQYVIYKLFDRGFPTNFVAVEAALFASSPAHIGLWLAPWDTVAGLTDPQLNLMHGEAIDVLSDSEIDGGIALVTPTGAAIGKAGTHGASAGRAARGAAARGTGGAHAHSTSAAPLTSHSGHGGAHGQAAALAARLSASQGSTGATVTAPSSAGRSRGALGSVGAKRTAVTRAQKITSATASAGASARSTGVKVLGAPGADNPLGIGFMG